MKNQAVTVSVISVLTAVALLISIRLSRAMIQGQTFIAGNHPNAVLISDWHPAPRDLKLHMIAVMALHNLKELESLKTELQRPSSPNYHKWLSSAEFARRFGPTAQQMNAVVNWLAANHFTIDKTDLKTRTIRFSGTAAQAERGFSTAIVSDSIDYANVTDPQLPEFLGDTMVAIFGLSKLSVATSARALQPHREAAVPFPQFIIGKKTHFSPQDFWTYYDESSPITAGNSGGTGTGDCIGLLENADTVPVALDAFNTQFSLPPVNLTVLPTDASHPLAQPSDNEPILDVDWAHAVAPNTPIIVYVANDPTSPQPHFDALSLAVGQNACGAISSSIDDMGSRCPDLAEVKAFSEVDSQAVVQGQTLFHSSGDYGSFYPCGQPGDTQGATGVQPSVEESSASPDVTVVGGTQFDPAYDSSGINTSVLVPDFEHVWNEFTPLSPVPTPTPAPQKDASGGGISVVFSKPPWQEGIVPFGLTPSQFTMRGVPDVAAAASPNHPGLWIATTNAIQGCPGNAPICFIGDGGTSASSPIWAGISRLLAQSLSTTRMGNINPRLYALAAAASPALVDVSQLGQNCTFSNCSVFPGFQVGPGYDLATGLGSPDINKLISGFPTPTPTATPSPTSSPSGTPTSTPTASTASPTATPTVSSTVTPTAAMTASTTPSITPFATATFTPIPGAQATSSNSTSTGVVGQTVDGGTMTVTNTSGLPETISTVTLNVSDPALFAFLSLSASVNGGAGQDALSGPLGATTTFTFTPPLKIPVGGGVMLTLSASMVGTSRIGGRFSLAGLMMPGGGRGAGSLAGVLGLLNLAFILMPEGNRRRIRLTAAILLLMAATQVGCGGSSKGIAVIGSSEQSVPFGGVAVSNVNGPVSVEGLPATLSTIRLVK